MSDDNNSQADDVENGSSTTSDGGGNPTADSDTDNDNNNAQRKPPPQRKRSSRLSSQWLSPPNRDLGPLDNSNSEQMMVKRVSATDACGSMQRRKSNIKKDFQKAMSPLRKRRQRKKRKEEDESDIITTVHGRLTVRASTVPHVHDSDDSSDDEESCKSKKAMQYRLTAQQPRKGSLFKWLGKVGITVGSSGVVEDSGTDGSGCTCCGFSLNGWVTSYLNWTFRASFFKVIFSLTIGFYVLTLFFAALIYASGNNYPECVHVNGQDFGVSGDGNRFGDAYALSWTTFSTVGYGLVFPSHSGTSAAGEHRKCTGIQILCTFESFVGILFASFCGAIVFGKVARTRSHAEVTFSDPIVVRYGKGVKADVESDSSSDEDENEDHFQNLPCPALEFRVINLMHSTKGGELMDATMNVVASIDASQACTTVRVAPRRRRRRGRRQRRPSVNARGSIPRTVSEQNSLHDDDTHSDDMMDVSLHPFKAYQTVDDDELDGEAVSRRIFSKIELETPDHPFFKRHWKACHTLNEYSPLLSPEARRLVRENNGFWPAELNNHASVREHVNFHQILVSLSGTSNAGANTVYAQKVYDYVDLNIGYRFVNVLFRNPRDGSLEVDVSLLNDVIEQNGGGAEPLHCGDALNQSRVFVM